MSNYKIISTEPTIYQDQNHNVVNGVLVRFSIGDYDELHEVRVAKMDVALVKASIETLVGQRDELAALGQSTVPSKIK